MAFGSASGTSANYGGTNISCRGSSGGNSIPAVHNQGSSGRPQPVGLGTTSLFGNSIPAVQNQGSFGQPRPASVGLGTTSLFGNSIPAVTTTLTGSQNQGHRPTGLFTSSADRQSPFLSGSSTPADSRLCSYARDPTTPAFGSAFSGVNLFSSAPPAFGSTAPSAFGCSATFGSTAPPAFGCSATFGSGVNLFDRTTPAFGSSATQGSATPAFGSTTPAFDSGFNLFGRSTTPAFGSNTTPAFGSTTPAFDSGFNLFGRSTTPAFGSNTSPAFGSSSTPAMSSMFISTPTPSFSFPRSTPPLLPKAENQKKDDRSSYLILKSISNLTKIVKDHWEIGVEGIDADLLQLVESSIYDLTESLRKWTTRKEVRTAPFFNASNQQLKAETSSDKHPLVKLKEQQLEAERSPDKAENSLRKVREQHQDVEIFLQTENSLEEVKGQQLEVEKSLEETQKILEKVKGRRLEAETSLEKLKKQLLEAEISLKEVKEQHLEAEKSLEDVKEQQLQEESSLEKVKQQHLESQESLKTLRLENEVVKKQCLEKQEELEQAQEEHLVAGLKLLDLEKTHKRLGELQKSLRRCVEEERCDEIPALISSAGLTTSEVGRIATEAEKVEDGDSDSSWFLT